MRSAILGLCMIVSGPGLAVGAASPTSAEQRLDVAARELVRVQSPEQLEGILEEIYVRFARATSIQFQGLAQASLKRALSEDEKQRLYLFFYRKAKELLSYTFFEDLLVSVYSKHLTLNEIEQINDFYRTPVGRKLAALGPAIKPELNARSEELWREKANKKWTEDAAAELKREIPSLFPQGKKNE
jgi:hypothetical protein